MTKYDWADTKVHPGVRYPSTWVGGSADNVVIGMIDSFTPKKVTPHDIIDSISDHNQGMVSKPSRYSIDITCKPFGEGFKILQGCQNGDRYFDVVLQPLADYGGVAVTEEGMVAGTTPDTPPTAPSSAWQPGAAVFIGCKVNDVSERYSLGNIPTVTFSCVALRYAYGEGLTKVQMGDGYNGRGYTDIKLQLATE